MKADDGKHWPSLYMTTVDMGKNAMLWYRLSTTPIEARVLLDRCHPSTPRKVLYQEPQIFNLPAVEARRLRWVDCQLVGTAIVAA